jgi:hypothetical protein
MAASPAKTSRFDGRDEPLRIEAPREGLDSLGPLDIDHANLLAPWFQDSVVEVWRGGNKLVPIRWLNDDPRNP